MTEAAQKAVLIRQLDAIEERICSACHRAGRARGEVILVAVTKMLPVKLAALLPELGVLDLGESRPQELWHKTTALPQTVRWHLIGHLQRNKIERTVPLLQLLHSVDSMRLLAALEEERARQGLPLDVLLEVNASREPAKHGFTPQEVLGLVPHLAPLRHLRVRGLMTMAAFEEDPEHCRPTFALVRQLGDRLQQELGPPYRLEQLSMGMSNDFEVAIEEGATLVRIGTALFEGLT